MLQEIHTYFTENIAYKIVNFLHLSYTQAHPFLFQKYSTTVKKHYLMNGIRSSTDFG